jgi:hypothetical protein
MPQEELLTYSQQTFAGGMDTRNHPALLDPTQYRFSQNTVHRGGIIQTRPGFRTIFEVGDKKPKC